MTRLQVPAGVSTWIEIRREALLANLANVRRSAAVPVCAVVKANGYGHGLLEAARIFEEGGADRLGVTRLEEARALREAGVASDILIMAPGSDPIEATRLGCAFAWDQAPSIDQLPDGARVHLKVDTGMGRFGVRIEHAEKIAAELHAKGVLEGVMTHFADASSPEGSRACATFSLLVHALKAKMDLIAHASGSAGLLLLPNSRFDMVRVGTLLYGQNPPGAVPPWQHHATFSWFARVASVRSLEAGDTVGYGSEYKASRSTAAVTVPIGWADGFGLDVTARTPVPRERAARMLRAVRGGRRFARAVADPDGELFRDPLPLKVVGRIGMQATTFTDPSGQLQPGSIVEIPARRLTISADIPRIVV